MAVKTTQGNTKKINLQNIHGDQHLKNQATADTKWRELYEAVYKAGKKAIGSLIFDKIKSVQSKLAACVGYDKATKAQKKELESQSDKLEGRLADKLAKSLRYKKLIRKILAGALGAILVLMGFDQGQVEVRVMAQASGDKNLIKDCKRGDIHSRVGHTMTGWAIEKIKNDKKTRTLTKNVHFGILFGLKPEGLLEFLKAKDPDTDLTLERIEELYANYFRRYRRVAKFILNMHAYAASHGYIINMFGFKRPLNVNQQHSDEDEFNDERAVGGAFWKNQAVNTPIQGAAHCLMFMAMAIMVRKAKEYGMLVPTLEVHDYMGFKVPIRDLIAMQALGKTLLEEEPLKLIKKEYPKIKWKVPLVVEGNAGFRLGDQIEIGSKKIHEVLAEMLAATFVSETRLDEELRFAA